jgi:cyclophilin family peptidyl-prolyl cis-trans isomerase
MTSYLKTFFAAAILSVLALGAPLTADEAALPAAPEQPKAAFTLDGVITPGEYDGAEKIEIEVWNKKTATVYLINSGKYLIAAFDVPDMCTPVASASILIDGKGDSNEELAEDDAWVKFAPEQVERPRCEQLRGGLGMWDEVDAQGWTGRGNMALLNRWQCEIVIDLDAFGVKHGNDAKARCMVSIVSPLKKDVTADYPAATDMKKPATWSLEVPVPGTEAPGFKVEYDADAVSALQKKEAAAVVMLDDFVSKIQDTQRQYTSGVQDILQAQKKESDAYTAAVTDGKRDEAIAHLKELAKLARDFNALLNERAQKLAALPSEADNIAQSLGEERTEVCDTQATLYLNLFQLDPSSYTAERVARCADYFTKAFKLNPNIINNQKVRLLMSFGCIREAASLIKARLALDGRDQEFRLLGAICDLRMGDYSAAAKAIDALSKEKTKDERLLPEIEQHVPWAQAAEKLREDEQARLKADEKADLPRVELDTTKGKIVIELFEDDAPNTVKNFISLVEQKFFDGNVFFRVEGWIAQTGDPEGCGMGTPGYLIKSEANKRKHFPGYIGMARFQQADTEGCQFYFNRYYSPFRDDEGYTIFGRVVEGMDVLDKIERLDKINTATVIRKREGTKYEPVKIEQ